MEAYLALRGLRTLPLRLAQAQASAQMLAERLLAHPAYARSAIPGLPGDPGHDVAARVMSGFGSLISIELADADDGRCHDRRVPALGVRDEPRWRRVEPGTPPALAGELPEVPEGLIRLSVGHRTRRGPVERPRAGPRRLI